MLTAESGRTKTSMAPILEKKLSKSSRNVQVNSVIVKASAIPKCGVPYRNKAS